MGDIRAYYRRDESVGYYPGQAGYQNKAIPNRGTVTNLLVQ